MPINITDMFHNIDKKWMKVLTSQTLMPLLTNALKELNKSDISTLTPSVNDIFNFARITPYGSIKVVIVGQDPYPKAGEAHGLAFSSLKTIPPSLQNIYKCLISNKLITTPSTGDLTYWARQGVLLLNTSLTTVVGQSNAHSNIWAAFTDELIRYISYDSAATDLHSLIFMLWGNSAQAKEHIINEDCVIYKWSHPSPLAQHKEKFIDCDHFIKSNALISEIGAKAIDWNPSPVNIIYTDGACSNNGKGIFSKAGYSTYFAHGYLANTVMYGKVAPVILNGEMTYGTNQRGEGLGIICGLEALMNNTCAHTIIVTDSNFWKEMIELYMPTWDSKGVDFTTKKNHDLTIKLWSLIKDIKKNNTLEIIHVASHNKDTKALPEHIEGNRIADVYAVKGKQLDTYDMQTVIIASCGSASSS